MLANLTIILLSLSSCTLFHQSLFQPKRYLKKGFCKKSFESFQKINKQAHKHKQFAFAAAEICLKKYSKPESSFLFYDFLYNEALRGDHLLSPEEIHNLEKNLADISFVYLKKYETAIRFYKKQLKNTKNPEEIEDIKYNIAESFFHLKKYDQSLLEIDNLLEQVKNPQTTRKSFVLKGRLFLAQQKIDEAVLLFTRLIQKYPKQTKFFREYLALIYEERKEFVLAIKEMEKISPADSFVRSRIKRLQKRLDAQPGVGR